MKKDFFFKSAKVFGEAIPTVLENLRQAANQSTFRDTDHDYLEFHVSNIELLKELDVEVGISSYVMETRENNDYMRELKVDLTYPDRFVFEKDV